MAADDWRRVLDVNLDGTYNVCRAVIFEMMKRKAGAIVTISSVAGLYGNPGQVNYSASKGRHHRLHPRAGQGGRRARASA